LARGSPGNVETVHLPGLEKPQARGTADADRRRLPGFRHAPDGADAVDETPIAGEDPAGYVRRLARAKADANWRAVARAEPAALFRCSAADTTVAAGMKILGKPESAEDAAAMLQTLSGRTHRVYTAVAVAWQDRIEVALRKAR
jgi:septum formation protein